MVNTAVVDDDTAVPTCYGLWFHPYLNWRQKLISKLIDYVLCSKIMAGVANGTEACIKALTKIRDMFPDSSKSVLKPWQDLHKCPLAFSKGNIPFQPKILHDWGIVQPDTVVPAVSDKEFVSVLVRFPSSLLPQDDSLEVDATTGCISVDFDKIDWKTFAPDVPVIIQFHGGGMVIGKADDVMCVEETIRVVETACNMSTTKSTDVITVSVEYALAPEDPFPRAVMEALSVVDYLKDRKALHVSGMSAGAHLCLVAGMEGFRRLGNKIVSIHANAPFLDPSGAGKSYYTNSAVYPNGSWLRWCWQVYLGLEPSRNDDDNNNDNVLRKGSNYTAWNKWKAEHPELQRLVNPTLELPEGLDSDEAPTIIVRYNLGDPLHSDGEMVAKAIQNCKKSHCYESVGLHCGLLGPYDPKAPQEYWKVWAKALFG